MEAAARRSYERGFGALYQQHITQANQGCDFDFLEGTAPTRRAGDPLIRCRHDRRPPKLVDARRRNHAGAAAASAAEARTIARRLVDSNLVGHDSHGVLRVGKYLEWVRDGWLQAEHAADRSCSTATRIAIVDGNRGFGQVIGEFATRLGIAKAAKTGIAMIGLRNCGHLGRLGDWAEMAAAAGQVSLHFLNTSGAQRVAPFGGSDRRLSTNPIAIGVPLAGGRSGDPRHHDVDGRRRQADGRAEQGRAGARRLDRRQARQADDATRRISTTAARC